MSFPNLHFWSALLESLNLEICAVVALGFIAQLAFGKTYWKRAMWQISIVCLLFVSISEWTGLGRGTVWHFLSREPAKGLVVTTTTSENFRLQAIQKAQAFAPLMPRREDPIWWPGWVWLAGTVIVVGRMTAAQGLLIVLRFRREKIEDSVLRERVDCIATMIGLHRKICLLRMPETISPMAFGFLGPTIGLPPGFETLFSGTEQDAILAHELAHLTALDPLWFRIADFATALLWWHPLVWWARRSLHGVSELAADEATALVEDGPNSLANCLVALGKKMTSIRGWGWVGVNGGFRSKLGKRVERLTRMSGECGLPFHGRADRIVRAAVTILIVPSVVLLFGAFQTAEGERENGWRDSWNSSPGGLLVMAATDTTQQQKPEEDKRTDKTEISHRVQDAKLLYEMGKLEEAQSILKQVLTDDPSNQTAAYYLDLIKVAQFMNRHRRKGPTEIPLATNDHTQISARGEQRAGTVHGRENILSKLNTLHMDEVSYDLPLKEVLNRLEIESKKRDPEGKGINFYWDTVARSFSGYDMTGNAPAGAIPIIAPHPSVDLSSVNIKISPALRDVRLIDVLNAITMVANQPIQYAVEDYAVVFSSKPAEAILLYSKTFHVDPNTFVQRLQKVSALTLDSGTQNPGSNSDGVNGGAPQKGGNIGLNFVTRTNNTMALDTMVRKYFTAAGVNLTDPGKSVFFNDRLGLLLVRATAEDLQRIEAAIGALNQSPPQVVLKPTKSDALHSKAFQTYPTEFIKNLLAAVGNVPGSDAARTNDTEQLNQLLLTYFARAGAKITAPDEIIVYDDKTGVLIVRTTSEKLQTIEQALGPLNKVPAQITISTHFVDLSQKDAKALGFERFLQASETNLTSVMSFAEYQAIFKSILEHTSSGILAAPRVTTLSGRQAHIASQYLQKITIGTTTTNVALGPAIDVIATVAADGYFIRTVLVPTYTEFLQYDSPGKFVPSTDTSAGNKSGTPTAAQLPLPHFRTYQLALNCNIRDGQTVVTGHLISDGPSEPKKLRLFFAELQIIDPAGNRVHSDEELSAKP